MPTPHRHTEGYDEADFDGYALAYDEDRSAEREHDEDDEVCDGSGEIHFNASWRKEPWNDDSRPCPGCAQCEAEGA